MCCCSSTTSSASRRRGAGGECCCAGALGRRRVHAGVPPGHKAAWPPPCASALCFMETPVHPPRPTQANSEVSALLGRIPSAVGYQPTLATDLGQLQERITTTKKGSITSVQARPRRRQAGPLASHTPRLGRRCPAGRGALRPSPAPAPPLPSAPSPPKYNSQAIYVPADDLTDPAPATTFAHLDATTVSPPSRPAAVPRTLPPLPAVQAAACCCRPSKGDAPLFLHPLLLAPPSPHKGAEPRHCRAGHLPRGGPAGLHVAHAQPPHPGRRALRGWGPGAGGGLGRARRRAGPLLLPLPAQAPERTLSPVQPRHTLARRSRTWRAEGAAGLQEPAGHHCHSGHGRAERGKRGLGLGGGSGAVGAGDGALAPGQGRRESPRGEPPARGPLSVIAARPPASLQEDKMTVARARKIQRFLSQPFAVAEVRGVGDGVCVVGGGDCGACARAVLKLGPGPKGSARPPPRPRVPDPANPRPDSQCSHLWPMTQVFTGTPGKYVDLSDTIEGFRGVLEGECSAPPAVAGAPRCVQLRAWPLKLPHHNVRPSRLPPTPPGKYDDLPEMAFYMVGDISEVVAKADKMAQELAGK